MKWVRAYKSIDMIPTSSLGSRARASTLMALCLAGLGACASDPAVTADTNPAKPGSGDKDSGTDAGEEPIDEDDEDAGDDSKGDARAIEKGPKPVNSPSALPRARDSRALGSRNSRRAVPPGT